jgi:hypothetical protein
VSLNQLVKTSIDGKVVFDGEIPPNLAVVLQNVANGNNVFGSVSHDGSLTINGAVAPGRYSLLLANTPELYIQRVTAKGGNFSNGELEVTAGAQIDLTINAARGLSKVEGVVRNGEKPVEGAMVLLIPQDRSRRFYSARPKRQRRNIHAQFGAARTVHTCSDR